MTERSAARKGLGVWDLSASPVTLGRLLIFLEEMEIQRTKYDLDRYDLIFIGDSVDLKRGPLLAALTGFENLGNCYLTEGLAGARRQAAVGYVTIWPKLGIKSVAARAYESTEYIQRYYRKHRSIPALSCRKDLLVWARGFFAANACGCLPVIVHLKNNPDTKGQSNANMNVWYEFFKTCGMLRDLKFILIGEDWISAAIKGLPNVILSRLLGSDLAGDLALIQAGPIFMGMSSGPCNMAIFNNHPYVIFKNPNHHAKEMAKELRGEDRFLFSTSGQRLLRQAETPGILLRELAELCAYAIKKRKRR